MAIETPVTFTAAALIGIVTLFCAVLPAWQATRVDFSPFLRPTAGARPSAWRLRRALVVTQIALSCVLLIGAGLLGRTVSVLLHEDHGFEPDGAVEAKLVLSDRTLPDGADRGSFVRDLVERVRALPGVQHAGFGSNLPPRTPPITIAIRLIDGNRDETRFMKVGSATPGHLRALGARFLAGRDFEEGDGRPDASVVILSESIARFYFRDENPIGRSISRLPAMLGTGSARRVVGVVRDIKYEGLDAPAGGAIYVPWVQRPMGSGYLLVRGNGEPMRLAPEIR
ncbi:MAG: ABC transporter permease, partial [Acidobacteria bacterium]|nr:ABC transporter permease [Acidobacteriota bacterium]